MITKQCNLDRLLQVVADELDRTYYGIDIIDSYADLTKKEFIDNKLSGYKRGINSLYLRETARL
jgi:hypothetical protein